MKIVLTGGGSGGHITPLLAVAHELKLIKPDITLIYIGQKGDSLNDIPKTSPDIDEIYTVRAGKFRRYHGVGIKQLVDLPTIAKNVRDAGRFVRGLSESKRLLKTLKPDIIFIKGGFVGVPVGLAAAQLKIPYITHDSDIIPGLANRIIARWATIHAVAMSKQSYKYPISKTVSVGVPVSSHFKPVNDRMIRQYKQQADLNNFEQVVLVTGGGNGARQLNHAVADIADKLLKKYPKLGVVHISGRAFVDETLDFYKSHVDSDLLDRVIVKGFVNDLYMYSGAADVVIARGSATNLAEFALQAKACIIVPANQLVWTVKNAEALSRDKAVVTIEEQAINQKPSILYDACVDLLDDKPKRNELAKKLALFAHPNAAKDLAKLLLETL